MAAAKLCCTAPLRSQSPDDTPSRPVRHFKSLANIKTHFAHDKRVTTTMDGHLDRRRRLYPADDLELRRIFVAASLPEDHPHALMIGHRKPEVDESIIRSPSFTNKLRRQLSRKSPMIDKPSEETTSKLTIKSFVRSRKRPEYGLTDLAGGYDDDAQSLCLTESRLASLKNDSCVMTDAKSVQHIRFSEPVTLDEPRRSISVPPASCSADSAKQTRRSLSSSDTQQEFKGALTVHLPGPTFMDANDIWPSSPTKAKTDPTQSFMTPNSISSQLSSLQLPSITPNRPQLVRAKSRSTDKHRVSQKGSTNSLHLYDMQISQHLRTQSQVSDASSTSDPDRQNRNTHASLNSIMLSSLEPGFCKSISSISFAGSAGPSTWEQVLEDESSSIYSRRTSTALETPLVSSMEYASGLYDETIQGNPIVPDVPGPMNKSKGIAGPAERVVSTSTGISVLASDSASHSDLKDIPSTSGSACVSSWPTHSTTYSLPKSDSSGSLGKLSKFKEDLNDSSAIQKSAKKRRSVLRILFPKLKRSNLRSTSTPLLGGRVQSSLTATYDGTGEAQDLLSIPQSSSKPQGSQRAVSLTGKANPRPASALSTGSLAVTPSSQSRQSLVNYERSLSIVGDNRGRKSTLSGLNRRGHEVEVQDEDPERTIYRASPLLRPGRKGTEEALMEKALLQHQLEKAALLRPSNQKIETVPSPLHAPIFSSPFGFPSASEAKLAAAAVEDLDPLEVEEPLAARRSRSMQDLGSSRGTAGESSLFRRKKRSTIWTMNTATTKGTRSHLRAMTPPHSWSRYPSHTRERRCSPAGRHDGVIFRDFAYMEDPRNVQHTVSPEGITGSPKSWPRSANAKRRNWIVKSRSMTFGTVLRYYSNLLTSSAARNRRSSTATGGRLEHPELEVLPPMLPPHSITSQHLGAKDQFARLMDHIEEEGHHIKEEGLDYLHRHRQASTPCVGKPSSRHTTPVDCLHNRSQSVHSQKETEYESEDSLEDKVNLPVSVDGNIESKPAEPERALSARRLSRMYQAYVQLPVSLDNTEVERSGATDGSIHMPDGPTATAGSSEINLKMPETGFLTIPAAKPRLASGPVTRHFPSVTVVDDRKGHWRSVSLLSVDSGKSVRKSTRDLLEAVRVTQTQELEKLLGTSEMSIMDVKNV